jgi:hypothetical protein
LFSTTRLVPSPAASAATAAVTEGLSPLTSTTTEAAEAAGGDTGGTIFVVTIVPIFTGEIFFFFFLLTANTQQSKGCLKQYFNTASMEIQQGFCFTTTQSYKMTIFTNLLLLLLFITMR